MTTKKMSDKDECFAELANAIILKALEDYKKYYTIFVTTKDVKEQLKMNRQMVDIKDFILSEYFTVLTELDPKILVTRILQIEKEVDNEKR